IWSNASRQMYMLLGNGASFTSYSLGIGGVGWKVAGSGDINGDGRTDVIWHNSTTNQHGYWLMGPSGGVADSKFFSASSGYRIAAVGDFNGDGLLDEIWTSNARDLWLLTGTGSGFNSVSLGVGGVGWVAMNPTP
ncbi:MAG: VCBS repeat-containing protein, partial [Burkholderiales bacterium]